MIQPNMPRFVREGDLANITGRLSNTSSKMVTGIARIELLNPETEKIVYSESHSYTIRPEKTAVVGFNVDLTNHSDLTRKLAGFDHSLLICRMIAEGSGYRDGEQHYLPVLPNTELVTNTLSFTQNKPGRKTIDLTALLPANSINKKLTVEYTNHPSWLMIQSLPSIATPDHDNAVSLAAAYYANGIAAYLMRQKPVLKNTAAERAGIKARLTARFFATRRYHIRQGGMEQISEPVGLTARKHRFRQRFHQRIRAEYKSTRFGGQQTVRHGAAFTRTGRMPLRVSFCGKLECHGRFSLEGRGLPDVEDRADAVEKPSRTGGNGAVQPFIRHRHQCTHFSFAAQTQRGNHIGGFLADETA